MALGAGLAFAFSPRILAAAGAAHGPRELRRGDLPEQLRVLSALAKEACAQIRFSGILMYEMPLSSGGGSSPARMLI
jgi:hypothetical protein